VGSAGNGVTLLSKRGFVLDGLQAWTSAPLFYYEKGLFVFAELQEGAYMVQVVENRIDPAAAYNCDRVPL